MLTQQQQDLQVRIQEVLDLFELPPDKGFLFRIAMAESAGGRTMLQLDGPAIGIFQMEPETIEDIIKYAPESDAFNFVLFFYGQDIHRWRLACIYNLSLQIVLARLHLMRFKEEIPESIKDQAAYWKKYWNTQLGKGTITHFIRSNYV